MLIKQISVAFGATSDRDSALPASEDSALRASDTISNLLREKKQTNKPWPSIRLCASSRVRRDIRKRLGTSRL